MMPIPISFGAWKPDQATFQSDALADALNVVPVPGGYSVPMPNSGTINRAGVNVSAGTSATADPPSNTSFGGTQDYLWLAAAAVNAATAINSAPSGYTNFTGTAGANSSSIGLGTAWKTALASVTEDPNTFGLGASVNWTADTLAIWDPVTAGVTSHGGNAMLLGIG